MIQLSGIFSDLKLMGKQVRIEPQQTMNMSKQSMTWGHFLNISNNKKKNILAARIKGKNNPRNGIYGLDSGDILSEKADNNSIIRAIIVITVNIFQSIFIVLSMLFIGIKKGFLFVFC